jgi:hypothetical protein
VVRKDHNLARLILVVIEDVIEVEVVTEIEVAGRSVRGDHGERLKAEIGMEKMVKEFERKSDSGLDLEDVVDIVQVHLPFVQDP